MSYRFDKYENCRHKFVIEEGGKHCLLCGGIVYDIKIRWLE